MGTKKTEAMNEDKSKEGEEVSMETEVVSVHLFNNVSSGSLLTCTFPLPGSRTHNVPANRKGKAGKRTPNKSVLKFAPTNMANLEAWIKAVHNSSCEHGHPNGVILHEAELDFKNFKKVKTSHKAETNNVHIHDSTVHAWSWYCTDISA